MACGLNRFYLGQYIIELLQYHVSRRTMTAEINRWRKWPKEAYGLKMFNLGQYVLELLLYSFYTTFLGGQRRWRASGGDGGHQVASGLKKFFLGQYVIELLQYYISRRTNDGEYHQVEKVAKGGIRVEKV